MKATHIKVVICAESGVQRNITEWETATPSNVSALKKLRDDLAASPHNAPSIAYKIRYSRPVSDLQRAALEKGIQSRILRGCVGQLKGLYYRHYGKESEELRQLQIMLEVSINEQYRQAKEKLQCKKNT